jgi:hypothetical protein
MRLKETVLAVGRDRDGLDTSVTEDVSYGVDRGEPLAVVGKRLGEIVAHHPIAGERVGIDGEHDDGVARDAP